MTSNAILFILLIIGILATVGIIYFKNYLTFIMGILSLAVWIVSLIMIATTYPYMIFVYILLMVIDMIIAFAKVGGKG